MRSETARCGELIGAGEGSTALACRIVGDRGRTRQLAISGAVTVATGIGALVVSSAAPRTVLIVSALLGAGVVWAELRQKERGRTVAAFASGGLAVVGLYLALASGSATPEAPKNTAPAQRLGLKTGDVAQVRLEPTQTGFDDPVTAGDGSSVRYRLMLTNLDSVPIRDLWVRLSVRQGNRYDMIESGFSSTSPIDRWPTDAATVEYAHDAHGPLELDPDSARLTDADGTLVRELPRGIDDNGVNIGDVGPNESIAVEVIARMPVPEPPAATSAPQIERGDFVRGRNLSDGDEAFADPVIAGPGDRLLVRTRVHVAAKIYGGVTAHASVPDRAAPFSRVRVKLHSEQANPPSSRDDVLVNFARGQHLRLVPVYGTSRRSELYGHADSCPSRTTPQPIDDGIFEGGIPVTPVGYQDPGDDCTEVTPFIDFVVKVVR